MNDQRTQAIHAHGFTLAEKLLACEFEMHGRHARCPVPWRKDETPSLDVLREPHEGAPAGSYIDRATEESGDVLALAARVWGLDCKSDFPKILGKAEELLGIKPPSYPAITVGECAIPPSAKDRMAATYGLEWKDFEQYGCKLTRSWFPGLGRIEGREKKGTEQPSIIYPSRDPKNGDDLIKSKTFFRYHKEENGHIAIAKAPDGKRHSSGRGIGFFPRSIADMKSNGTALVITGGEEKAIAAIKAGFVALSWTHGEKPLTPKACDYIVKQGWEEVIIAFDNDKAGMEMTPHLAGNLLTAGILKIRSVNWPVTEAEKADLCDILKNKGKDALAAFLEAATPVNDLRPQIVTNGRQRRDIFEETWRVVVSRNEETPRLFRRSGLLVRKQDVSSQERHESTIHHLAEADVYGFLARNMDWVREVGKRDGSEYVPSEPPRDLVRDMIANPHASLPMLETIIETPIVGKSGRLISTPGYHASDAVFLEDTGLVLPEIPSKPTRVQIDAARQLLMDVIQDFPFVSEHDKAHAFAAMILPFVRRCISGPTPMHLISAPTPGSGKSLLAAIIQMITTGQASEARSFPEREEERQKFLFTELLKGPSICLLDNASNKKTLDSSTLALVLTSVHYSDRLLGTNHSASVPNLAMWLMTANNPRLSNELTRRCIRIRIDPRIDQPWLRDGFTHENVVDYCQQNRVNLVVAALTIINGWLAAKRPLGTAALGSFESWSSVIGGILQIAGVDGFLGNLQALYEEADQEGFMWRQFVKAWWDFDKSNPPTDFVERAHWEKTRETITRPMKPSELAKLCRDNELMDRILGDNPSERSQSTKLGRALGRNKDRTFDVYTIELVRDRNGQTYRLRNICGTSEQGSAQGSAEITTENIEVAERAERAEPFGGHTRACTSPRASHTHDHAHVNSPDVPHVPQVPHNTDSTEDKMRNVKRNVDPTFRRGSADPSKPDENDSNRGRRRGSV